MLQLLDIFLAGVSLLSNITIISEDSFYYPKERDAVVAVAGHREWWRDDGKGTCRFTGLMVPFNRDWEETINVGGEVKVIPALPDSTAGHALLINKKICKEKDPEDMFRIGATSGANFFMRLPDGGGFQSYDFYEMKKDNVPRWLPQVLERIERVAMTDPDAQAFVKDSSKHFAASRGLFLDAK